MIELTGVAKEYPSGDARIAVLSDVNVRISAGEFVSIMGPSGSGKSTLMHILGCLDVPSTGTYALNGVSVTQRSRDELARIRNTEIGFVFQNFHLLPRMTAERNVELPMMYAGLGRVERRVRARELLLQMGLQGREHHRPNQLSGGQKQRVAIARALANRPHLLLADEPTGALDSNTGREIMQLFLTLHQQGVTVVVITHDADIAKYAKRIIRLSDGRIVSDAQGDTW